MFRFDGEVFLLGTAIAAPLKASIKIATIFASSQQAEPAGGGWIVATERPYSESAAKRKVGEGLASNDKAY